MFLELTGQRFGRLVALRRSVEHHPKWECLCDCGNIKFVDAGYLSNGRVRSCGCLQREIASEAKTTHGMSRSPEYAIWSAMVQRCSNPNCEEYHNYGGRGIQVCDRWRSFENFFADMGHRPSPDLSLDRYPNNNGNYELANCRWATLAEQNSNTRRTAVYEYQDQKWTAPQLAAKYGISNTVVFGQRLKNRWDVERAITQPIIPRSSK